MLISEELMTVIVCISTDIPPKAIKKLTKASSWQMVDEFRLILLIPLVISIIPRTKEEIKLGFKPIVLKKGFSNLVDKFNREDNSRSCDITEKTITNPPI